MSGPRLWVWMTCGSSLRITRERLHKALSENPGFFPKATILSGCGSRELNSPFKPRQQT